MKGRTMNSLIQRNRQLQYLFIALLLVGFAITQSAMGLDTGGREPLNRIRNKPPNHPEFRVKLDQNVPCAFGNERVQLNGTLQLHFETINGVAHPKPMASRLEATGTGQSSHRTYVAISTPIAADVDNVRKVLGETHGHLDLEFKVVANPNPQGQADVCPGCVFQFTLKYSIHYSALAKVLDIFGTQQVLCP
jgi:hypothetical protein